MRVTNLQQRLLTAAVGLPLVILLGWAGGWPFAVGAATVFLLAALEFVHGWLMPNRPMREALGHLSTVAIVPATVAGAHVDGRFVWMGLGFALVLAALGYAPTQAFGPRKPLRVYSWCSFYLGVLGATLVLVRGAPNGLEWFFLGLLSTFAVDTGAYAVGRAIGRHRMAPRISPKKTWEGAAGGYAAGVVAVLALNGLFDTGVGAGRAFPLAIALPLAAIGGDLVESWMKRRMGVKDASGLLPGHGGFMDRLDSVLFVFPLVYLFLQVRVL